MSGFHRLDNGGTRFDSFAMVDSIVEPLGSCNGNEGGVSIKHANDARANCGHPRTQCGVATTLPPVNSWVHSPIWMAMQSCGILTCCT